MFSRWARSPNKKVFDAEFHYFSPTFAKFEVISNKRKKKGLWYGMPVFSPDYEVISKKKRSSHLVASIIYEFLGDLQKKKHLSA